jgi:3-hydroxyisobutyrate dehydrogenase-like beta-hydroxyacid dehydrogenase
MDRESTIGVIGLGLVGSALAERLSAAGFPLVGYDVDTAKIGELKRFGVVPAMSPAEVSTHARRLILSLPTSTEVRDVIEGVDSIDGIDGVLETAQTGDTIVDTTTAAPSESVAIAEMLTDRGIPFLDATILGSSTQVRNADTIVMVGGDASDVDAMHDLFDTFARKVFHMGPSGTGATTKLVANMVLGLHRAVLAEALVFGEKVGIAGDVLLEVLRNGSTYSSVMDIKGDKMLDRSYEPQGRLAQHLKDVDLALDLGRDSGAPIMLTALHAQLLRSAVAQGFGGDDNSAIIEVMRGLSGLE